MQKVDRKKKKKIAAMQLQIYVFFIIVGVSFSSLGKQSGFDVFPSKI